MDKNELKEYLVDNLRINTRVNNGTITINISLYNEYGPDTIICEDYISIYDIKCEMD